MNNGRFGMPYEHEKVTPPHGIGDLPRYLRELLGGFFYRLGYIFALVWKTAPWILFVLIFIALFDGIMPVVGSVLGSNVLNEMQVIIEQRAAGADIGPESFFGSLVLVYLIVLFAYRITNRLVKLISNSVIRVAGELVTRSVKVQIMEKAKTVDLASFDNPTFYEKLENANREAGNRPISTLQSTFAIVSTVISLVSYIVVLATVPGMWWIPIVIMGVSVPSAVVNFVYRKKFFRYIRFRSKDRRQMNYYSNLMVNKDMAKEIRLLDLSDTMIGRFEGVFKHYYAGLRRLIWQESIWHIVFAVISAVTNCLFFAVIAYGVYTGEFKIGQYNLYTGALTSIASGFTTLISTSASIYEGTLFIDNLIDFMKEKQTVVPRTDKPERVGHGMPHTVEFKNVSFAYPGTDRYVIKNVNLKFRPGETVVLVGLNGAGKTTLIKLLTRLYDPSKGEILLDGRDLRDYDVADLYRMFGIIFQDFGKYAVSVRENVEFGEIDKEHTTEQVEEAIHQANAEEYVARLPEGIDTPLMRIFEPNGIELSGGQWQKLAIARAFYRDSDILILDEPTASLDPMAEQEIFNQFDLLREGKMTIFVSHRLSSAVSATKIVVLQNGEVIEEGDHRELMALGGIYCELFTTQARRYREG